MTGRKRTPGSTRTSAPRHEAPATGSATTGPDPGYTALRQAIGRLLAADRRLRARDQQRRNGTLSHAHTRALFVLMQQDEVTAGTLAKAAELNPASVTAMIDHLEAEGLVQRRRDQQDRRQCWVSLTDIGRKEVEEKERRWRARMDAAMADVTPEELATTGKVLMRIASVMESLNVPQEGEPG